MSHHGKNPMEGNEFLEKLLRESSETTGDPLRDLQRKLQGEFPDGRLNAHDEGALAVMVGIEKGSVVMKFPTEVAWLAFTPEQAKGMAQILTSYATKAERQTALKGLHD